MKPVPKDRESYEAIGSCYYRGIQPRPALDTAPWNKLRAVKKSLLQTVSCTAELIWSNMNEIEKSSHIWRVFPTDDSALSIPLLIVTSERTSPKQLSFLSKNVVTFPSWFQTISHNALVEHRRSQHHQQSMPEGVLQEVSRGVNELTGFTGNSPRVMSLPAHFSDDIDEGHAKPQVSSPSKGFLQSPKRPFIFPGSPYSRVVENDAAIDPGPSRASLPRANNRECFQQRLKKYHLTARYDFRCAGPQHALEWKCFCYIGSYLVGRSSWHSTKASTIEEVAERALAWLDMYGYS